MKNRALRSFSFLFSFTAPVSWSEVATKACPSCQRPWRRRRQFSTTPSQEMTRLRSQMFAWLNTRGKNFETPIHNDTNYLTDYDYRGLRREDGELKPSENVEGEKDPGSSGQKARSRRSKQPFPLNNHFHSQPMLSEQLREEIWKRVKVDKKSVRIVSIELGVEMRRVGAVVRLVEVEKQWRAEVCIPNSLFVRARSSRDEQKID